jgi:sensor c-di-GMP phosphodiesterase-like protein
MSTLTDEIDNQVQIAQHLIERSLREVRKQARGAHWSLWLVATGVMIGALATGAGVIVYRRRRGSLAQRLQNALPGSVRGLPDELRAQLKRPLERAVRVL